MSEPKLLAEWFWTDRWIGSSAFLLPLEPRGLYREMLTQAWRRGGKLPNDPEAIRRAVGCTAAEWRRCWPKVSSYWQVDGEFLINQTQSDVIAQAVARHESAVERGRKGGQQKAQKRLAKLQRSQKLRQSMAREQLVLEHKPPSLSPIDQSVDKEHLQTDRPAEEGGIRGEDIRAFIARFCELYSKHRHGAKYMVQRVKDIPLVRRLLQVYPASRLEKLTVILLTTDHEWVTQTDRGIPILSTKISWLDSLLSEHEAKRSA
jgi:uncharacterized protein YdaU (DUF1376 family)